MTTDPLPTHDARVVPPPTSGVHSIEFLGDETYFYFTRILAARIVKFIHKGRIITMHPDIDVVTSS